MTLKSDVYISLEENDSHLIVRGELRLLEKLLRSLRADSAHDDAEHEANNKEPAEPTPSGGSSAAADDLTRIDGIGPATAAKLAAAGVVDLTDLVAADAETLAAEIGGASAEQVAGWQEQALSLFEAI